MCVYSKVVPPVNVLYKSLTNVFYGECVSYLPFLKTEKNVYMLSATYPKHFEFQQISTHSASVHRKSPNLGKMNS